MRNSVVLPMLAGLLLLAAQTRSVATDLADVCHASSSYDLSITGDRLIFERGEGSPQRVEIGAGRASADGVALRLNVEDSDRLALFDRELRALLPRVRAVASGGVDMAIAAVRAETAGLGLGAASRRQIDAALARRGDELKRRVATSTTTRDWQGPAFDRHVDAIVADIAPIVAADLGAQAVDAAVAGDLDAAASLRARAEAASGDAQPRLERRMEALRPRIAALCPSIARLYELQRGVRDGHGHTLDLLDIETR